MNSMRVLLPSLPPCEDPMRKRLCASQKKVLTRTDTAGALIAASRTEKQAAAVLSHPV